MISIPDLAEVSFTVPFFCPVPTAWLFGSRRFDRWVTCLPAGTAVRVLPGYRTGWPESNSWQVNLFPFVMSE
jgi:hypothetical protein